MLVTRAVAVAFGSNLGDRDAHLRWAVGQVSELLSNFRFSSIIETAPVGPDYKNTPLYLNAAGVGESILTARELMRSLLSIEAGRGRERPYPGAPRTLDLDLILVGDEVLDEPGLCLPHPRFRERDFVLKPLAEVGPDLKDPVTGLTVAELLARI